MPSPNTLKVYSPNTFYHIYNFGLANQCIFFDAQDYFTFQNYLTQAVAPPIAQRPRLAPYAAQIRGRLCLYGDLQIWRSCLLPNHFHLFIYQHQSAGAIRQLGQSVFTAYAQYFNRRHQRLGSMFCGVYRAIPVVGEQPSRLQRRGMVLQKTTPKR